MPKIPRPLPDASGGVLNCYARTHCLSCLCLVEGARLWGKVPIDGGINGAVWTLFGAACRGENEWG